MSWEDTLKSGRGNWEDTLRGGTRTAVQEPVELDWSGAGQLPRMDVGPQYAEQKPVPEPEVSEFESADYSWPSLPEPGAGVGTAASQEYPLAKNLFMRPYLAAMEAAVPGARRAILSLADVQMPKPEFTAPGGLAEQIEQAPWYKKMPEIGGWGAEKFMEYKALSGIFRVLGLSKVLGAVGNKVASKIISKELATVGGKQALLKPGLWSVLRNRVLTSAVRTAPENMAFLAAWSASEAARRGEDIGPAAGRGALWGLGLSGAIPLIKEGIKAGITTKTFEKIALRLQAKYPRLADYLAGKPEQEFIDAATESIKAEAKGAGQYVPEDWTFSKAHPAAKNIIKALARQHKKAWQKALQREAAAKQYWAAGRAGDVATKTEGVEAELARMDRELAEIQRGTMAETPARRGIVPPEPRPEAITKPEPPAVAPPAETEAKPSVEAAIKNPKKFVVSKLKFTDPRRSLSIEGALGEGEYFGFDPQQLIDNYAIEEGFEEIIPLDKKEYEISQAIIKPKNPLIIDSNYKLDEVVDDAFGNKGQPVWHKVPTYFITTRRNNPQISKWAKKQGYDAIILKIKDLYLGAKSYFGTDQVLVLDPKIIEAKPPAVAPEAKIEPPAKEAEIFDSPEAAEARQKAMKLADKTGSVHFIWPDTTGKFHVSRKTPNRKTFPKFWTGEYEPIGTSESEAISKEALKKVTSKKAMRPGFVDVSAFEEIPKTFMRILEPSKAVERKLGKEAYAAVIKGIHATDAARVKFEQSELPKKDKVFNQLEEYLDRFPDSDLDNLMLSRGEAGTVDAQLLKRDAINKLPKELRSPKLLGAIQHIADVNHKYLQSVVGDDVKKVKDYYYGIYKSPRDIDKFIERWITTKRFLKQKRWFTYSEAKAEGHLQIRDPNPVRNLKSEYVAIAHLEGMNWLKEELLRTGKGKFIDDMIEAPVEWDKVNDPTFSGLRLQPDLAKLVNNLIATNKITKIPIANALKTINDNLRTLKFIGSAFHLLSVAKQSVADSGYLGFWKLAEVYKRPGKKIPFGIRKGMATQGITFGFRKNDPEFRTPFYKRYIRNGGGHRYSVESESRRAFNKTIAQLNKEMGKAVKYGALPLRIPLTFVNWMFNSYIPKVKYAKTKMWYAKNSKKLGRELTDAELQEIIKEGQNFYGMMNERLFGRSGTVTTSLRYFFMSPSYAEGNFRSMIKAAIQWGGKKGFSANRSRSNIVNSLILTGTLATIGTMILTGKPPKKPETAEDLRDLFKIDTGKTDDKGRSIMIDLMTYDKDYWQGVFNVLKGRPDEAVRKAVKRIGGMKAPTADMITDLALISMGRAVYDWKGDRVTEITDPFLRKLMKLAVHEVRKIEPIPFSVYKQSRRKGIDTTIAFIETVLGFRPTMSEEDKRLRDMERKIWSLKGEQEELFQALGKARNPRKAISKYNGDVHRVLQSPLVPKSMRKEWEPKLLIDLERLLANKVYYLTSPTRTPEEIEKTKKYLKNFGIGPEQAQEYLNKYWTRERKKTPVSPLERDRVIGRGRKRRRLQERMTE